MITWTSSKTKMQRLAKTNNADDLVQLSQDWNTGYHLFNQKLARYYSRKQQFTSLIANQSIYQTPIDSVRIMGMTALVTNSYEPPIDEISSEQQWRRINSYKTWSSNWPSYYIMLGNDEFQLWPVPSQNVTNGIRFWYQPQDHDLSIDDITSTTTSTTVTMINGSNVVTATNGVFTAQMAGLSFQLNGVTDLTWYEIESVPNATTLNLKSAFVGIAASGLAWTIGQTSIIPQGYQDAPMHYALGNYFSAQGNEVRSAFHMGQDVDGKRGIFYQMVSNCLQDYSSSTASSVITEDAEYLNPWLINPNPSM